MKYKLGTRIELGEIFELSAYFLLNSVLIHLNVQLVKGYPSLSVPLPTIVDWIVLKYGAASTVLYGIQSCPLYFCFTEHKLTLNRETYVDHTWQNGKYVHIQICICNLQH